MANKKNKTPIVWPEGHFTIDDVQKNYSDMVNITLRFRVKKATSDKEIAVIGRLKPAIGRPKLVFAKAPVTEAVVKAAFAAGVLPPVDDSTKVPVVNVKQSAKKAAVQPAPAVASEVTTSTPTVTA